MKKVTCDRCDDEVVVADREEDVVNGETPVEHLNRTGHAHRREPRLTGCSKCGSVWYYTGDANRATCPDCKTKVDPGTVPNDIDDAWARANTKSAE